MKPLSGFKKILNKFWIRKDRENYLFSGVLIASIIGGFVSSYWHYLDRMEVLSKITMDVNMEMNKEKEFDRFKEAASYSDQPKAGDKQYYKIEENPALTMPELYKEEEEVTEENKLTTVEPLDNIPEDDDAYSQEEN